MAGTTRTGFPLHRSVWLGSGGAMGGEAARGKPEYKGLHRQAKARGQFPTSLSIWGPVLLSASWQSIPQQLAGLEGKWTLYSEDSGRLPASSAKGLNAPAGTSGSQAEGRSPGGEGPGLARSC